jgi:glycosyltransferase involved in cell wall biosynthesis
VSAIIVNPNRADLVLICLESLLAQSYRTIEIIVVDNGSLDESEAVVRRFPVRRLPIGRNLGMGPAYNCGPQMAQGKTLLFLNEHIRLQHIGGCVGSSRSRRPAPAAA